MRTRPRIAAGRVCLTHEASFPVVRDAATGSTRPRVCGNAIFAAEGEVRGRVNQVRYVELALFEQCERKKPFRASASSHPHCLHCPRNTKYIHDSLEVVCQYLKAHFGTHPPERPGLEVCGTHPMLERAEDVFNGASSDGHRIRLPVKPTLQLLQLERTSVP